jgi:glycosyltransferase involved in cell wall biosynthesis
MDKYIYKPTDVSEKLKVKVLKNSIYKTKKPSSKKDMLNKTLNFISPFNSINLKDAIVIDAIGLPYSFLNHLQLNDCKVIYNHAGSPNAVMKYFGMDGAKRDDMQKAKNEYLEMINHYSYILFQSPTQAKDLYELAKWNEDRTVVVRPSASMKDINQVKGKDSILNKNDFNIIIVGSVQERKGQHLLPKISKILSELIDNIKFHIVGNIVDIDYRLKIEKDSKALGQKEKVIFQGFKSNYLEYMNSADVILQVSEEEGVSRILREAMALKKMIISFRLDGTNDLLEDQEDCLLSEYGDIENIANDILKVYKDKELRDKYSSKALENFESKYSKKEYHRQLKSLIEKLGN